ncbi:BREX-1 system phosphatase PglZ type B [Desulfobulbus alkaliphilus]|uniref:BREX-1 system phosphatase PglZ type B n=1 Tax=Desulfobulbus alkaliphilus TaxID=869814 RepID=UPI001963ABA4|nr:BREX-1 system phosphatase PglZ type B [Desulfobulbus alkaliphilus]MBM9536182.1 BREX-1 system phosphatase PglZ type B [Desulfobulbus alkaliphilus]
MTDTPAQRLVTTLRSTAQSYAAGDQIPPCVVLWADPDRLWKSVIPELQVLLPELYLLGSYSPEKRTGPALWLRCIEARAVDAAPPAGTTPIFYLPGISREMLRAAEDCPPELAPLVELQYRGAMWLNVNRKEWTPHTFLISKHGGLDLEVAKDRATLGALAGALSKLLNEPLPQLQGRRLDADFFNGLVAPDATGLLLRWLSDPEMFQQGRTNAEWRAFCQQCKSDAGFDPVKDGPLRAAGLLTTRLNYWAKVWHRYIEAPTNYPGIVEWLKRATPKQPNMFETAEVSPGFNERDEQALHRALEALVDRPQDEVMQRIADLEKQHGVRRSYPWQKLGLSPLVTALEPLAQLAELCRNVPGAPSPDNYARQYAEEGWRVDAAALATMAACDSPEQYGAVLGVLRAVYLPWLEESARHLQQLIHTKGPATEKRTEPIEPAPGRLVLFADGLRMDVAQQLVGKLSAAGIECSQDWEWSTIPTVTATAKPAAAPIAGILQGDKPGDEFAPRLIATGQTLTQDRFVAALRERDWQVLQPDQTGDPNGSAWTEAGALDKRGHTEGWKLARSVDGEVRDLASRIGALLRAGWTELVVVTDHGWLLVPGGLPKVELKAFLTETRWSRCAALKSDAHADIQAFTWHWNPTVMMASPPGAGSFFAGIEYAHGGVSLQEMVIPVLRIQSAPATPGLARLQGAKWTGAKCRVTVEGQYQGVKVDVRTSLSDPNSSLLADKQARELTAEGKVSVFLENDADIGRKADIVLLDSSGQVIHSLPTTLGQ